MTGATASLGCRDQEGGSMTGAWSLEPGSPDRDRNLRDVAPGNYLAFSHSLTFHSALGDLTLNAARSQLTWEPGKPILLFRDQGRAGARLTSPPPASPPLFSSWSQNIFL